MRARAVCAGDSRDGRACYATKYVDFMHDFSGQRATACSANAQPQASIVGIVLLRCYRLCSRALCPAVSEIAETRTPDSISIFSVITHSRRPDRVQHLADKQHADKHARRQAIQCEKRGADSLRPGAWPQTSGRWKPNCAASGGAERVVHAPEGRGHALVTRPAKESHARYFVCGARQHSSATVGAEAMSRATPVSAGRPSRIGGIKRATLGASVTSGTAGRHRWCVLSRVS